MKSIQQNNIEDYYIWTNKLTKVYGTGTKKVIAVDGIDFTMSSGVHGFLGPNGAGKTSTINMLIGAISITEGEAFLKGKKAGTKNARKFIGFLPQDPAFYEKLSGLDYLILLARLNSIPKKIAKQKALNLLKFFDLMKEKDRKIKTYSMGMKQKIGLAAGLIHDPKLLI
ncbi:MAG: ABC transporter ATP-binding protein, partial [Candidatus Lokiarchaeota archaeon]|nr:ABC transporter ATP-binding protein [Candidatus Lokiarchaeota archaeon]